MVKKEIIARLYANPNTLPTLEEVIFIIQDNKKDTLELSKKILRKAKECRAKGEEFPEFEHRDKFFDLEKEYLRANIDLWEHQVRTEGEWLKVQRQLVGLEGIPDEQEKFWTYLLELHDEKHMTKH